MAKSKKPHITGSLFYYWVRCPYWAFLELHQSGGKKSELSDLAQRLIDEGVKYEQEFMENGLDVSKKDMKTCEVVDLDEATMQTLEWMEQGVEWIHQGVIMDEHYVGRPDLMRKKPMPTDETSRFGDYYYEPVDIKSGRSMHTSYKLQIAFYAFVLERIQQFYPPEGGIINIDQEYIPLDTKDFKNKFQLTLDKIEDMIDGEEPLPFVGSSCRENPWEKNCIHAAESCNHISLVYRIPKRAVMKLAKAGIEDMKELSEMSPETVKQLADLGSLKEAERLVTQAKSVQSRELIVNEKPDFPKAKRELYMDIEGDPFERVEYLFGFLDVHDGKEEYISFVAERPEEEEKMWKELQEWAKNIEPGTPIFHYADYERQHMMQLAEKYGIDPIAERALFDGLYDLLNTVRSAVVLPLYFYSLKDVARYLGFEWRHEKAGGAQSILWYQDWLETNDREKLNTIINYNEDDVRATKVIKDWFETL